MNTQIYYVPYYLNSNLNPVYLRSASICEENSPTPKIFARNPAYDPSRRYNASHICVDWRDSWANLRLAARCYVFNQRRARPASALTGSAVASGRALPAECARLQQGFRII
jgi:hypothetical protein